MPMTVTCKNAFETRALAEYLATFLEANDVLLLSGDLGAGKTEFTKGIAAAFGVAEAVNSPTFNLLLVHEIRAEQVELSAKALEKLPHSLYHFDLYRLDSSDQLDDLDYFGLLEDGALSVVEWGDRFGDSLPADYLLITLTSEPTSTPASTPTSQSESPRTIQIAAYGPRSTQILEQLQT